MSSSLGNKFKTKKLNYLSLWVVVDILFLVHFQINASLKSSAKSKDGAKEKNFEVREMQFRILKEASANVRI